MRPREPHVAGHSTHFLRRLERACDRHLELALTLYRDEELLTEVLRRASVPESAARAAISLEPGDAGPFVVVTRAGKFVTCLGAGMGTGDLFVVGFAQLTHAASRIDRMRDRLEEANRLGADQSEARRLFRVVERAGSQLAREEFAALARWEPLLEKELLVSSTHAERAVQECVVRVLSTRPGHASPRERHDLLAAYRNFWLWSHFSILRNVGEARRRAVELGPSNPGIDVPLQLTLGAMRFGMTQPSARALWAAGRQARALLPSVKAIGAQGALVPRAQRTLGLAVIAHASQKARAEATKALEAPPSTNGPPEFEEQWREAILEPILRGLADGTEASAEQYVARAQRLLLENRAGLEYPVELKRPEDIPADVAPALLLTSEASWVSHAAWMIDLALAVPWIARAEPAELFLPRAWARVDGGEPKAEDLERFATDMRVLFGPRTAPRRVEKAPGRNEPCPCGSEKKYKHCCARSA